MIREGIQYCLETADMIAMILYTPKSEATVEKSSSERILIEGKALLERIFKL
jgi:hypothetical protein